MTVYRAVVPGATLTVVNVETNDTRVAVYDADGIIISTPTGTTAYTLSAGGPVISPEVQAITITPICPHSFSAKAVVIPADKTIRIQSDKKNTDVIFALDGLHGRVVEIGFGSAIRREWEWRVKRGESLANLQAFAHLTQPSNQTGAGLDRP